MQTYDIQFGDSVASWKDIRQFCSAGELQVIRLATRLTDKHVDVVSVRKMRFRLAAQVLSLSVAAGLNVHLSANRLPAATKGTAEFVKKVDTVFDLFNSTCLVRDKSGRCAITSKNDNINRLAELKLWASEWQFNGARAQSIKCQCGLVSSINSITTLSSKLLNEGFKSAAIARFNQNCIENLFEGIRSKNGWHENPNAAQLAFRNAVVLST